jgi:cation:H+ antiporter
MLLRLASIFGLIIISTGIVWKGSDLLENASGKLADFYELPPVVKGSVVVAIGSSFPELSTTVLSAIRHGEFELGVATVVGSAIFNILIISGVSGILTEGDLQTNRSLVYKEAQFYIIAVAVLLVTFSFAVIYNPGSGMLVGNINRLLAGMPILMYLIYVFLQYQDTKEHSVSDSNSTSISPTKQWSLVLIGLVVIVLGVEGLVQSAIYLGDTLQVPAFLWGLTVLAVGTSIPDAFVSAKLSKNGEGVAAIANVLGSNTFDLLVVIPTGVLIAGTAAIDFTIAAPLMGILVFATIILFVFSRTELALVNWESHTLIWVYIAFIIWMTLESSGITSLLL